VYYVVDVNTTSLMPMDGDAQLAIDARSLFVKDAASEAFASRRCVVHGRARRINYAGWYGTGVVEGENAVFFDGVLIFHENLLLLLLLGIC